MKKILSLILLMMAGTGHADVKLDHASCADVAIRYTVFGMFAREAESEIAYKATLYETLLKSDADVETKTLLVNLMDLAWKYRNEDLVKLSNYLYTTCVADDQI